MPFPCSTISRRTPGVWRCWGPRAWRRSTPESPTRRAMWRSCRPERDWERPGRSGAGASCGPSRAKEDTRISPLAMVWRRRGGDPAAVISRAALDGRCELSSRALDLFVSLYAAEAGNFALKVLATGGVYLGGGIAPKILTRLRGPAFMRAFSDKGRMQELLESMPVWVILDDETALLGAARYAALRAGFPDPAGPS